MVILLEAVKESLRQTNNLVLPQTADGGQSRDTIAWVLK